MALSLATVKQLDRRSFDERDVPLIPFSTPWMYACRPESMIRVPTETGGEADTAC